MNIFDYAENINKEKESPLASRLRPKTLEQVVGQNISLVRGNFYTEPSKLIKSALLFFMVLRVRENHTGKVIANTTSAEFMQLNATVAGKKDMQEVVEKAKQTMAMSGRKTILFIDEIHRFNKSQQDYLLPFVEDGTIVLIGATTENPYFEVNTALISRSIVFELHPLTAEDIKKLIFRAIEDKENGMGIYNGTIDENAADFLGEISNGDARMALNAVELGILTTEPDKDGKIHITLEVAEQCIQKRALRYDKSGDNHYDTISAFIKSMRGSDPDAAVYYLARMLYAGESVDFIARRIMICAAEDVGMANPQALVVATSASRAVHRRHAGGTDYLVGGGYLCGHISKK